MRRTSPSRVQLLGLLAIALTGASGCKSASAPPPVAFTSEDWSYQGAKGRKLTSDHYELFTTCKSKPFVDAMPGFMETCWSAYEKLISPFAPPKKCETYLFGSRRQWEQFTEEFAPARAAIYKRIRSGGYSERGLTVSHYDTQRSTLSVLAHEGLHQYLEVVRSREVPAWLNEGLACYFEAFELDAHNRPTFTPTKNSLRSPGLREALTGKNLIPLKEILGTHAGIEVQKKAVQVRNYYSQEWALIVMLMRPKKENSYHDAFQLLLAEMGTDTMLRKANAMMAADTEGGMTLGEAVFQAYLSDDLAGFQAEYEAYLHKLMDMDG